jgi:hypothetical protein
VLYDHLGRAIARRKQYGLTRAALEYALVIEPRQIEDAPAVYAVGYVIEPDEEDEDEGLNDDDRAGID